VADTDPGGQDVPVSEESAAPAGTDPRAILADWANDNDEWIRFVVRQVLDTGLALSPEDAEDAYQLFRQEKAFDERTAPVIPPLTTVASPDEADEPLTIEKLSDVTGVNALVPGAVIEPHEGLTVLFGENGTGKTGYSRIFKALAASRTADVILGNIAAESSDAQAANIVYKLGTSTKTLAWTGQRGVSPFIRMSIFDSPSVNFHVDDDLEYTYVPAALALFNHVIAGLKMVQAKIDTVVRELTSGATTLLSRFPKDASVYPLIETLGAATNLDELKAKTDIDPNVEERIDVLRRAVAALEANTIATQIATMTRVERILTQATHIATVLTTFDSPKYGTLLKTRADLDTDYRRFRDELFAAADLPAEPEDSWQNFVAAGEQYRQHLDEGGAHNPGRCLYCRQELNDPARELLGKYSDYLADKISGDISATDGDIKAAVAPVNSIDSANVGSFVDEYEGSDDIPPFYYALSELNSTLKSVQQAVAAGFATSADLQATVAPLAATLDEAQAKAYNELTSLRAQADDRVNALVETKKERDELIASAELARSWSTIESQVSGAKEANRLGILSKPLSGLTRSVTVLAKAASDQLINQSFDTLFHEECAVLRAPQLQVEFVGRQGKAQRRKMIGGNVKPSKVLSEGEQKVLAIADFLAEARLAGIDAPVIFDDPVSSLDHRRIHEVARRIAALAEENQVIVFTHDIFFASTLLALFEKSKRCAYFQVTDEEGKGEVSRATGPRWDTVNNIKKKIVETIQAAQQQNGEARAALVRTGYDWIRSWCEVFTEIELLQGVTQRYQPNVRMTTLPQIKVAALPAAIETVTQIFDDACRYIDGHSQPLASQNVSPTLAGLETQWQELQAAQKAYRDAEG
jgi:energy-coupling factor transporter ATP-binding protein EcfA2